MDVERRATTAHLSTLKGYVFGDVTTAINQDNLIELNNILACIKIMPPASVYAEVERIWADKRTFVNVLLNWGETAHKFLVLGQAALWLHAGDEKEKSAHNSIPEEICISILDQSPDVITHQSKNMSQPTVLHIEALARSEKLVQKIFAGIRNVESFNQVLEVKNRQGRGKTPLRMAVEADLLFLVRRILEFNKRPINDPNLLRWVLNEGSREVLQTLIELRPQDMNEDVLQHAMAEKDETLIDALRSARECHHLFENREVLHEMVRAGATSLVTTLLDQFPWLALELDKQKKPVLFYNSDKTIRDMIARIIIRQIPSIDLSEYRDLFTDEPSQEGLNRRTPPASEVVRALIADAPDKRKEISLSLGGFGSWVSSAQSFLDLIRKSKSHQPPDEKPLNILLQLDFEATLIYVDIPIPDLPALRADGKPTLIRSEVWLILDWLRKKKHVEQIYELSVRDSCYLPHAEGVIRTCLKDFNIAVLDWCRPDLSLEVLHANDEEKTLICPSLNTIRLYAGGWPALAYWTSEESLNFLGRFPQLRQVDILVLGEFVGTNVCETYAAEATGRFKKYKEAHPNSKLNVKAITKTWSDLSPIDQRPTRRRDTTAVEVTKLSDFLNAFTSVHMDFAEEGWRTDRLEKKVLLNDLDETEKHTPYIRVAVIDNGVDPGSITCHKINGASFVPSQTGESNWWYIRHAHGTKMARIVTEINPYCHLLVAKVGDSRSDFTAARIVKALGWAVAAGADIISLSLTLDDNNSKVQLAVDNAVTSGAVVIASVHGQGANIQGAGFPAQYGNVLAIGSADSTGAAAPGTVESQVDYLFQGEKIVARTEHLGGLDDPPDISGPSVATAVATGVASLVLACDRFALFKKEDFKRPNYHQKLQVNVVKNVFKEMSDGKYVRPWMFFRDNKAKPSWGEGDTVLNWISDTFEATLESKSA